MALLGDQRRCFSHAHAGNGSEQNETDSGCTPGGTRLTEDQPFVFFSFVIFFVSFDWLYFLVFFARETSTVVVDTATGKMFFLRP